MKIPPSALDETVVSGASGTLVGDARRALDEFQRAGRDPGRTRWRTVLAREIVADAAVRTCIDLLLEGEEGSSLAREISDAAGGVWLRGAEVEETLEDRAALGALRERCPALGDPLRGGADAPAQEEGPEAPISPDELRRRAEKASSRWAASLAAVAAFGVKTPASLEVWEALRTAAGTRRGNLVSQLRRLREETDAARKALAAAPLWRLLRRRRLVRRILTLEEVAVRTQRSLDRIDHDAAPAAARLIERRAREVAAAAAWNRRVADAMAVVHERLETWRRAWEVGTGLAKAGMGRTTWRRVRAWTASDRAFQDFTLTVGARIPVVPGSE